MTAQQPQRGVPSAAELERPEDPEELHAVVPDDPRATVEDYHPDDVDPEAVVDESTPTEWVEEEDWEAPDTEEPEAIEEGRAGGPT